MLIKNPKFEVSAVMPKQYPNNNLPQIVLVGKSNVGKSSFINTMTNRKSLARASSEPGKTRQINFYNIDDNFYFVDLPGYGYSKMSKELQQKVGNFIEEYLNKSRNIALIVHLVDIRHKPTSDDALMYSYLQNTKLPFIIVANKADKVAVTKVNDFVDDIRTELNLPDDVKTFAFSSEKKIYCTDLWRELEMRLGLGQ